MQIDLEALVEILRDRGKAGRHITAIAGPPGAGKSTISEALVDRLNEDDPGSAAIFAMDGFHYDDAILNSRGWRSRKGAPHTFDCAGFAAMLSRLRANAEAEIAIPVFDRSIEIARNAATLVSQDVRHLIVEGNYLLLDMEPWSELAFDTTVFLDVAMAELQRRLEARWTELAPEDRLAQVRKNDLPNAELVVAQSRTAEFTIAS